MSFLLIIVLFLSFGIISIREVFRLGTLTRMIYEHPLVVSNASLIAALNITKMHRSMKDLALANSLEELETAQKVVAENEQIVYKSLDTIRDKILGTEGQTLEKQTRQLFTDWKPIRQEVVRLFKSGKKQDAILITKGKGADHVAILESKMMELTSYARKKATHFLVLAETSQSKLEKISIILTIAGVILSSFIAFFITYRVLKAEEESKRLIDELKKALESIKTLKGLLPICAKCKKVRDDKGYWNQIERYIENHSDALFSHSICPECMDKLYGNEDWYKKANRDR